MTKAEIGVEAIASAMLHPEATLSKLAGSAKTAFGRLVAAYHQAARQGKGSEFLGMLVGQAAILGGTNIIPGGAEAEAAAKTAEVAADATNVTTVASTAESASVLGEISTSMTSGLFTSKDPLVADLANWIEAAQPGTVKGVNVDVLRADGSLATDIDIQANGAAIQVKSGNGKGLTSQMNITSALTGQRTIAYGPNLGPTVIKNLQNAGFEVYTNKNDLLQALKIKK